MKIGIIGAMDQEIKTLRATMKDRRSWERAGMLFVSGSLGRHEIILVRSGIGKVAATITTTLLIHQYQVNLVINTGSAGGIGKNLAIGDLVIANALAYFDVDVTGFGYKPGQLPGGMPLYFETSQYAKLEMTKAAQETGYKIHHGLIVSGDTFVNNQTEIATILTNFPEALACEMEGAAVAQTATQFNIPFLIVRAISDTADEVATDTFDEFIEKAGERSAQMVIYFINHLI
ncbi:5'-methylthioadenosine/adenosylhomocysteine nucleosidase [Melissococcus plutonius]|uniref:adenosylhomocysteine nucleosidase n=1 Tax=Melissococcus plutonius (strain ATCC 35311 / DSM 29964 / CIP 104052 / LMG 20360 / NCIMB 702443) TaxID=940190 RepID=F3Y9Y9_MELPT|nr:5'-methylthioadenosine/adenosylhomocysteine nucleosidase [Melissococcus plutonius]AIM24835.1 5'-methylthioadenosine/S-adenosylhomocysteine nucleosidase MtnN [Melissococcus plutonius S1]KMT24961.1 5'-methylthioadenosine/S-adenosylhomocysteine nucleosidase MtnN [Melissococcus plutonius]KMT26598.1 5'-methylthioadenosine/S-adenosylhomocysteine nucleosidase MtnN [Melissococcus plutonius]KMT27848.1 5'-methylthioadenosine/S-adenosylhomocysteine nucleosidase MtnN [Melissococcus plutonius]KMT29620.1